METTANCTGCLECQRICNTSIFRGQGIQVNHDHEHRRRLAGSGGLPRRDIADVNRRRGKADGRWPLAMQWAQRMLRREVLIEPGRQALDISCGDRQ
jgi:ferredoxin